jgi:hypothetical protein
MVTKFKEYCKEEGIAKQIKIRYDMEKDISDNA